MKFALLASLAALIRADDAHTCVGGGQMCDGSSNCPNKDDELGCGLSCALVDGGFGFECVAECMPEIE